MGASRPNLDDYWRHAQECLHRGAYAEAAATYAAILDLDRYQPQAWLALSSHAYAGGRFRLAVERARTAAVAMRESRRHEGIAQLAHSLQNLGESRFAVQTILGADRADPVVLDEAASLAHCLGLAEQHAAALELLDFALARVAPTPALSYARAATLRHLGRAEEATDEYQRCLRLAPDHAAAMLMLAGHAPAADAQGQLERIRRALAATDETAPQRPLLHYALFAQLDAAGDTAGAWSALAEGAAAKRRTLRYDGAAEQARDEAMMALCRAPFLASGGLREASGQVPIFIVGMPRTGTTVLERILGNHSLVASAGELNDFHHQLCLQADRVAEEAGDPALLEACASLDFEAVGRGYLQRTAWRAGDARFLIDKYPANFVYAGLIHKALPQAKLVCLLRDPMDSGFSNLKELFAGDFYPYSYDPIETAAHCLRFRRLLRHWDEVMPGALLTVRYEELVREPERVAREVMRHCGLPFEPGCVDLLRNTAPSATASSSQVRQPLHTRGIGAWRRYAGPLAGMRAFLEDAGLPAAEFTAGDA